MKIVYLIAFLLFTFLANAQIKKTSKSTTSSRTENSKKSVSVMNSHSKSSISITDSETHYQLKAIFETQKKERIRNYLEKNMGSANDSSTTKKYEWKKEVESKLAYYILLQDNKLKITLNKDLNSNAFCKKIELVGEKISEIISVQ